MVAISIVNRGGRKGTFHIVVPYFPENLHALNMFACFVPCCFDKVTYVTVLYTLELFDGEVRFETETSAEISCTSGVRMPVDIVYSHDGV